MVVVDDEPKVRLLLERAFRAPEFETRTFASGQAALESVLIPETVEVHSRRLLAAGFGRVTLWLQCLNFVSLLAQKT